MKKRWLSLAVAATAAITVLAGCGSKAAETTAAATEAATTEAASSEAAESSAEETKAEAAAEGEIPAPEGDDNKISIGVTPVPHAEIVNDVVVPKLEAVGWDVEVVEFNDYVQPNTSLEDGEIAGQGCLDARQRRLITLVVLAAIQTPEGIGEETRAALHQGVRPEEIREALYQCAPYIGFPRTEAALRHADAALEAAGIALPLPEGGTVSEEDRFEKGLAVQTGIFGDAISKMHASAPEGQREILVRHLSAFCFGDIYTRTGLDLPLRELLTFCIISALGGCEAQVKAHVQGNAAVGNGKQLLVDALLQMLPCIGFPRTLNALACVNSVLPEA